MIIAMGCDPNAQAYKEEMMDYVRSLGHEVVDFGSDDVIYAHVATQVGEAVAAKKCDRGILFCGTGIGVMLAANKVKGAYAANVDNVYAAKRACLSNNCNIITIGCQTVGNMLAKELISAYLDCEYVYNERSGKKVDAIVAASQAQGDSLRRAAEIARLQYDNGYTDYLTVLDAERQLFSAELSLANALRDRLNAVVSVCMALGGGWQDPNVKPSFPVADAEELVKAHDAAGQKASQPAAAPAKAQPAAKQ